MKTILPIARTLLGVAFVVFAANYFVPFLPTPSEPPPPDALAFIGAFKGSGLLTFIKVIELAAGLALIANVAPALAATLLAPIIVGIVGFHAALAPAGLPLVLVLLALELVVAWGYRGAFAPMLRVRIAPTPSTVQTSPLHQPARSQASAPLATNSRLTPARAIAYRTRGRTHGAITRLMSPSDLGEHLKPFVFLDLFDHDGPPVNGNLHPHSGIATLTYVTEGAVSYVDPDNHSGVLPAGGVEWMQAGRGMWHDGGLAYPGRTRGFQLWIALPPHLELGPTIGVYQGPSDVPVVGPARVLLGSHGGASSAIEAPSPINYLAVGLKAGERWRYQPPAGHTVLWVALASGTVAAPDPLRHGDLAMFESSTQAIELEALTDADLVLGSAAPHDHELVLGWYSVHTSPAALRDGEAQIAAIRTRLVAEGRRPVRF